MKRFKTLKSYTLYTVLVAFLFCSCNIKSDKEYAGTKARDFTVIEIDSCEYIFMSRMPLDGNMAITHKGNCKYCKERSKK
jgi:hypothetical protein